MVKLTSKPWEGGIQRHISVTAKKSDQSIESLQNYIKICNAFALFESIVSDMNREQPFVALDKEGLDEAARRADSGFQRQRQGLDT